MLFPVKILVSKLAKIIILIDFVSQNALEA